MFYSITFLTKMETINIIDTRVQTLKNVYDNNMVSKEQILTLHLNRLEQKQCT